jgi:hypothetical protein
VNPLSTLPEIVAKRPNSLAQRNLERGWRLGLPNGQNVAEVMGVKPLSDDQILIGKAVDNPAPDEKPLSIITVNPVFKANCPLWTYILAEAMHNKEDVKIPVEEDVTIKTRDLVPSADASWRKYSWD